MTCEKDTRITETVYPTSAYIEETDAYGQKVYITLKPTHGPGVQLSRLLLCSECKLNKARPQSVGEKLRAIKKQEDIPDIGDWTSSQKGLAKKLGLVEVNKVLSPPCGKCGGTTKVTRKDKTRGPLCDLCYKDYRRDYMRDLMRAKRETNHVV